MASRTASCSGLTRDRFLRSFCSPALSTGPSGRLLCEEDVSGDEIGEGVLEVVGVVTVVLRVVEMAMLSCRRRDDDLLFRSNFGSAEGGDQYRVDKSCGAGPTKVGY
jgi:hypothetical protein